MRENKFRAWDKANKRMIDFNDDSIDIYTLCIRKNNWWVELYNHEDDEKCVGGEQEFDLMQYTGLEDKNGKEIYEGDILKHRRPKGYEELHLWETKERIGEIYFWEGSFVFGKPCCSDNLCVNFNFPKFTEIIGNVYENPEILKKEK